MSQGMSSLFCKRKLLLAFYYFYRFLSPDFWAICDRKFWQRCLRSCARKKQKQNGGQEKENTRTLLPETAAVAHSQLQKKINTK